MTSPSEPVESREQPRGTLQRHDLNRGWRVGQEELLNAMTAAALVARDKWAAATEKSNHQQMRDHWQTVASHLSIQEPLPPPPHWARDFNRPDDPLAAALAEVSRLREQGEAALAEAEERAFELDEARELIEELQAGNLALTTD